MSTAAVVSIAIGSGKNRGRLRVTPWLLVWRGGRVVYGSGLENRRGRKSTGGSNPSLSAKFSKINQFWEGMRTPGFIARERARMKVCGFESLSLRLRELYRV